MTDQDVHLAAIVAGDPDAFASWVAGVEPRIRSSLGCFATAVDTEAVVQEALLRIWQVAPRVTPDGRPDALARLTIRIARNLAVSDVRRRRPVPTDPTLLEVATDPEGPTEPAEPDARLRELIQDCLQRLPERPRQAIEARLRAAGSPDRACAESLRMRPSTFLQNVRRARLGLAECLERHGIVLRKRP